MSIFTNWPQPAQMILNKSSSINEGCYTCQWLDNVDMHLYANLIQIYHVVQKLWAFLLTDQGQTDSCTPAGRAICIFLCPLAGLTHSMGISVYLMELRHLFFVLLYLPFNRIPLAHVKCLFFDSWFHTGDKPYMWRDLDMWSSFACTDPESFARGGPTLTGFLWGERGSK